MEEVSKATKIRTSFLQAIENGDYKMIPSGTYAHGFVRNYARFLELPEHEMLALFKREYDEEKQIRVLPDGLVRDEEFSLSRFKIAQTLKVVFLILVVLLVYLIFQYRSAIFDPSLSVSSPNDNAVVSSEAVTVIGKADSNSIVFVNSEPAALDKDGNFKKTVIVFPGHDKITVKSVNNFNRTTTLERSIEVKM